MTLVYMFEPGRLLVVLLMFGSSTAVAQDPRQEFRPEFDLYVSEGSRVRFLFQGAAVESTNAAHSQGASAYFVELALKPLLRRALRQDADVFRRRYLTFRAGYERFTTINNGNVTSENRSILEFTGRYPLSHGFAIVDRNRQESRWVEGRNFSVRYRNRLWVERDLRFKAFAFTPYVYDEVYFDTRFHAWSANRQACGVQVPVATRFVLEPYLLRQVNYQGSPSRIHALGFKFSAFF
jgi:Protein of unknown function (DUF2490)